MTKVSVRRASNDDIDALARLTVEVQELHFTNRPDQFKAANTGAIGRWFDQVLRSPSGAAWVAERDGEVVGNALVLFRESAESPFAPARKWWSLEHVAVTAAQRRTGVGRSLVEHIAAEARAAGIRELRLESWAFNGDAQAAFERLGFTPKVLRYELQLSEPTTLEPPAI
ncbi:MAG: GNAT family N-acetyltransferase [Polyangiaceae bacterium]